MKKIGLVGGISWTSTVDYYRNINEFTNAQLGSLNFAECIIYSVNFEHFQACNAAYDWEGAYSLLLKAALHLKDAGAEMILLGANTAHIVAERISAQLSIPLVDIRTATANAIKKSNLNKVALLGTEYTMELDFYKNKLAAHGIEVLIPSSKADRDYMEETLRHELSRGLVKPITKSAYIRIANELIQKGTQGIVLGCTEIPLLLSQDDFDVPVFNTTQIHAQAAVELALSIN